MGTPGNHLNLLKNGKKLEPSTRKQVRGSKGYAVSKYTSEHLAHTYVNIDLKPHCVSIKMWLSIAIIPIHSAY